MLCRKCTEDKDESLFFPPNSHRPRNVCRACSATPSSRAPRVAPIRLDIDESNLYRTIVADPPWPLDLFGAGAKHYALATIPEICSHTPPARQQSHLYLWCLNQRVDWGYEVARAWGFEPVQLLTWTKPGSGLGPFQCNTEQCLVARRGPVTGNTFGATNGTYFYWPKGQHSEKPNQFYDLVEKVSPGPYLEMYARRPRDGWAQWGNELPDPVEGVGSTPPVTRGRVTIALNGHEPVTVTI